MKHELNSSKVYLEQEVLDSLLNEVKETVAENVTKQNHKQIFSAADLWNIQKMKKELQTRRPLWN